MGVCYKIKVQCKPFNCRFSSIFGEQQTTCSQLVSTFREPAVDLSGLICITAVLRTTTESKNRRKVHLDGRFHWLGQ